MVSVFFERNQKLIHSIVLFQKNSKLKKPKKKPAIMK